MSHNGSNLIWTVCKRCIKGSRKVNPAPNGKHWICKKFYTDGSIASFLEEYNHGDEYSGYIAARYNFPKDENGTVDFNSCCYTDENFFEPSDFVISEEGRLIGFLAEKKAVLWIEDFAENGRFSQEEYGMVLRESEHDVEYGCLTHSRW